MKRLLWGVAYVLIFALSALGGAFLPGILGGNDGLDTDVDWNDSVGSIAKDLPYADEPLNKFDLYLPADRARSTKLVVYLHAGGFTAGDKADDEAIAKYFTSKGYVTATINYSLRADSNSVSVQQQSDEITQGIAAAVAAVQERGYPVNGMAVAGGSAGGTLAMIYGYRDRAHAPVPVKAIIQMVGPASFDPVAWFGMNDGFASDETAQAGAGFVSVITGAEVTPAMMRSGEYRQTLKPVTAIALVTSDSPPTLAAYGVLDKVAPYAASSDLKKTLTDHGVPHDVLVFPNSGHALNRDADMAARLKEMIDVYLDTYLPLS